MLQTTMLELIDADKLRAAMEAAGSSNRKLGLASDLSHGRISQLLTGQSTAIAAPHAAAIAGALAVPVATLFWFPDGEALIRLGLIRSAA